MLISVKKCWCHQNSKGVKRDSYIFSIFIRWSITLPSLIIAAYAWQILEKGTFSHHPHGHSWEGHKRHILNKVKVFQIWIIILIVIKIINNSNLLYKDRAYSRNYEQQDVGKAPVDTTIFKENPKARLKVHCSKTRCTCSIETQL